MSTMQNIDNAQIRKKTSELVESIYILSANLPERDMLYIKNRLRSTAFNLPNTIDETLQNNSRRINKIRNFIKAGGQLAECKEFLELIQVLGYSKTKHLIEQIDNVKLMLEGHCLMQKANITESVH
jgi:four helix bundle protein